MSKPTLVLVHGSWHSPEHFGPLIEDLTTHGYKCVPVSLPSTQSPDEPPANLTDDTLAVRSTVEVELAKNNVIVIAHSYGGTPTNNALKDLSTASRHAAGHKTSVLSLIFLAAIILPPDTTFLAALGGHPHPIHELRTPDFAWVGPPGPEHYFYNEMPPEEATKWAGKLRVQSWRAYTEATTYAAYREIECFYLRTRRDRAIPFEMQGGLLEGVEKDGGRVRWEAVDADHTPFIGKSLGATSEFVRRVAEGRFDEKVVE
ncbi:hypothetical protein PRZ48_008124 [Zasmidium cellare]|uniref:AB hydrolase-1 domain-containing protein n=1 Tax=Zasmidium cellare TaxID=395010 RepID=A0ABR0EFF7_ZASCE|nr:hypothetical protein PRZ48_008124 [Zasmidium cellare]